MRLQPRDLEILSFCWRWQAVTTSAIAVKFFKEVSPHSAYKRLLELKSEGFLDRKSGADGSTCFWKITKKGFSLIESKLPPLRDPAVHEASVEHDALASAILINDFLTALPSGTFLFPEIYLRYLDLDSFPFYVPKNLSHRSDGYWGVREGAHTIALEVEINLKALSRYDVALNFYESEEIHDVVWVTHSQATRQLCNRFSTGSNKHSFITLEDYKTHGPNAKFLCGKLEGQTLRQLLLDNHSLDSGAFRYTLDASKSAKCLTQKSADIVPLFAL